MYAIVEINGQQFKVEEGKKLFVHHIQNAEANQAVEFEKVLLIDNDGNVTVGAPTVEGAKVVCEVVSPLVKGEKVHAVTEIFLLNHEKVNTGVVQQLLHEIAYKADPAHLLDQIQVDVGGMKAGEILKVKDLPIAKDENIVLQTDPETDVVTVTEVHAAPETEEETEQNA